MSKLLKERIFIVVDKIEEYSLYLVVFFIPISKAAIESFVGLALLACIIKKFLLPDFKFISNRIHFFLLLFFIFCTFSLLNSGPYINKSLSALFFKWGEYILIFFLVQDGLASSKRIRNAVNIFLFVGALVAIDGIFQHLLGFEFLRNRQTVTTLKVSNVITGPFNHYNSLIVYLLCIFALFLSAVVVEVNSKTMVNLKSKIISCFLFFGLFLSGVCILLTFSRGGWIGVLFMILLMLILSGRWKIILPVLCSFILLFIFVPALRDRVSFIFAADGDASRFAIWKGAWMMIQDNPFFGKGLGTFMSFFPSYTKDLGLQYAHNCYLHMWAEIGIFGLLSFLYFVGLILLRVIKVLLFDAYRYRIKQPEKNCDFILLGLICGIFGFLVHSFFDNHFYSLQLSVLFWFLLGLTMAKLRQLA